jgi:hypothetical protein
MYICESCKHYQPAVSRRNFESGFCLSPDQPRTAIMNAREVCDKEGDGRFVYYEPKQPTAGAEFVQITREKMPLAMRATA